MAIITFFLLKVEFNYYISTSKGEFSNNKRSYNFTFWDRKFLQLLIEKKFSRKITFLENFREKIFREKFFVRLFENLGSRKLSLKIFRANFPKTFRENFFLENYQIFAKIIYIFFRERFFEKFFPKKISRKYFSSNYLENFSLNYFRQFVENPFSRIFAKKPEKYF